MSESQTVTVDAAELQRSRKLNQMLDTIWTDPKVGEQVRRRMKEIDPTIPIPDDHPVAAQLTGQLKDTQSALDKLREEYAADKLANSTKDQESNLRKVIGEVQTKRGMTDESVDGTIKMMQDRGIADFDAAAALYLEGVPKAKPQSASSRMFDTKPNLFGTQTKDDQWEQLHTDPDSFFRDQVNAVFEEMPVA